jgi:hypothetical protein
VFYRAGKRTTMRLHVSKGARVRRVRGGTAESARRRTG